MRRLVYIGLCILLGFGAAQCGSAYVHGNADVAPLLITVFTVFAGFMVAVIVILGDPLLLPSGSWRAAEQSREGMEQRLIRHMYLFFVYLATIGLIFVSVLIKDAPVAAIPLSIKMWIEWAYVWLSVTSLCLSFAMPKMLIDTQRARVDAEIRKRRSDVGIGDPDQKDGH